MWRCLNCGCMGVAHSLTFCPMCKMDRSEMAKTTVEGGFSDKGTVADDDLVDVKSVDEAETVKPVKVSRKFGK